MAQFPFQTMYNNSADVAKWFQDGGDPVFRYNYPLDNTSVVVDLGGFKGEFANKIYEKFGCYVHVFEPIKDFYQQCTKTNKNHVGVKVYPYGISGYTDGAVEISVEGDASSIFKAGSAAIKTEIILKPVQHLFDSDKIGLNKIDLLKINVEGAEFDILDALIKTHLVHFVENIQVQFHTFVPDAEAKREILHKELIKTHILTWNYPFVWENWKINA